MSELVIQVENLSKQYRLGEFGSGTLYEDLNRWWHKIRGKEDPYLIIGDINDRTVRGDSNYVWALRDINFEVRKGQVLGIIGKNGAGKSTLLKLLSKVTSPTTGVIRIKGRVASLLEVGTGFHPELTGRENIYLNGTILGMTRKEVAAKLEQIAEFAGVTRYLDTPTKRFSSGMMVRLGFSVAAHLEPEILIVDEVLAVGDVEFQKKCIGKMGEVSRTGRTILFVSHNMGSVRNLCDSGILLDKGQMVFSGSANETVDRYLSLGSTEEEGGNRVVFPEKDHFAQLLEVAVENGAGQSLNTYYYEDEIFLRIKYLVRESRRNLWVRVMVSRNGEPLFTSYDIDRPVIPEMRRAGEYVALVKMPEYLKAGVYTITVSLVEVGRYFDEKIDVLKFVLDDTKSDTADKGYRLDKPGVLKAELDWRYVEHPVLVGESAS
ncbi:MAG: ABC transporter ATP-binding protein [Bacteroidetes bacterium]|nr:MAG: ABC transporter ATP-binding protein [Bacteroidota bacterium]